MDVILDISSGGSLGVPWQGPVCSRNDTPCMFKGVCVVCFALEKTISLTHAMRVGVLRPKLAKSIFELI